MELPSHSAFYWHWQQVRALPRISVIKLLIGLGLAAGSLMLFAELVEEILEAEMMQIDTAVLHALHLWDPPWLSGLMYFVTKMGSALSAVSLSVCVIIWLWFIRRNFHAIVMFLIASLGGIGLNILLKAVLQRPRPLIDPSLDANGWSLPSGHAMSAAIFYGFITYLLVRSRSGTLSKVLFAIPLISFVLLIGISRIYLQAHYFSDVLAGYAAGCCWLMTCILTMEFKPWYRKHFKQEPEGHLPGDDTIPPEQIMAGEALDHLFVDEAAEAKASEASKKL